MTTPSSSARRPLTSRNSIVFQRIAASLAAAGVSPNAISFCSMVFALGAGVALAGTSFGWPGRACWIAAAAFIQLRLIANMLDGMVAVEGKRGGPTGELWNEAPDRFADAVTLIGAGLAVESSPFVGCAAALAAVFVAYVRALGASVGAGQLFHGPMAKPHRMFTMTMVCLWLAISPPDGLSDTSIAGVRFSVMSGTLGIIILGCGVTAVRRLSHISAFLRSQPRP